MKIKKSITVIVLAAAYCSKIFAIDFWSDLPNEQFTHKITDEMTNSELLSQTFMFGWASAEPP